ncbi:ABC transporter permease [Pseudactinotalea sp.]|uniref:ABC transporter permease n=1 Tax=Pseudactinotalea sp. TaxID=1926260 RepID=UPI003B3AD07D
MSTFALRGPGTGAVIRTETRLFVRELGAIFWIIAFPVLLLVILGLIPSFREPSSDLGGARIIDLYVPISILLSMIMAAIMAMPPVVFGYREGGVLRRLRTTPVRPLTLLGAQVLLHGAAVAVAGALVLVIARTTFGTPLPAAPLWYLLAYVLALVVTFGLGAIVTAVSPNARIGSVIGMIVFFASMLTAGVYFPVQATEGVIRQVLELTPLGAASEALHQATAGSMPDLKVLAVMVVWSVLFYGIAARTFRWE